MTKTTVKIVQRKRLADRAGAFGDRMYRQRVKMLPIFVMLASIAALIYLRVKPEYSKFVSRLIESSESQITNFSFLWSPLSSLVLLSLGSLLYMWMDYQHHKKPLIRIAPKTKYRLLHHLRVVVFPRFHYRWRPAFYWLAVAEACVAVFIAVIAMVGFPAAQAFSGSGLGSPEQPYQVSTCEQLQEMQDDRAGHYELTGPIDCTATSTWNSGAGFVAVGNGSGGQEFTGTLEGNGYAIDGLYQRILTDDTESGLLGFAIGASVTNVKLTNVDLATDNADVVLAPIASQTSNSSFSDVSVSGTVFCEGTGGNIHASGFVGLFMFSSATRISVDMDITNNSYSNGDSGKAAIASGLMLVSYSSSISDSYSTGTISGAYTQGAITMFAGGLFGQALGGTVDNSYSSMDISITRSPELDPSVVLAGGFAAMAGATEINNSFAIGSQTISTGPMEREAFGGFIGVVIYEENADPPFGVNISGSGNFIDVSRIGISACIGANTDGDFSAFLPEQTPNGFCSAVNVNNSQPNYFYNNSTNAPFRVGGNQVWDFTNVWKVVTSSTPVFISQVPAAPTLPGKVRAITTSSANPTSLTAQWLAPTLNGNTPLTDYAVQYKLHSNSSWNSVSRSPSTDRSQLIAGLVAGQMYDVRVAAVNAIGQGDWEVLENVSTSQLPSEPRNMVVSGVEQTNQFAPFSFPKLDWQVPYLGAPITDYVIQFKPRPGSDWAASQTELQNYGWAANNGTWTTIVDGTGTDLSFDSTNTTDTDLAQAIVLAIQAEARVIQSIDFRIAAVNSYGQGAWSGVPNFQVFIGLSDCQQMQDALNQYRGSVFHLVGNIDCSDTLTWNGGEGWVPVGDSNTPFQGTLDGQGFTISDLQMNIPANASYQAVGMFSFAQSAEIRNLTLTDSSITSMLSNDVPAATLIASASPDTILDNITVAGDVIGEDFTGGIVGTLSDFDSTGFDGSVLWQDIAYTGVVQSPGTSGGILGMVYVNVEQSELTMQDVQSHGTILDSSLSGGIIGGAMSDAAISLRNANSDMNSTVTCSDGAGGLIGVTAVGTVAIEDSAYDGTIACPTSGGNSDPAFAGGLVGGSNDSSLTITNGNSTGQIQLGEGAGGGLVGFSTNQGTVSPADPEASLVRGVKVQDSSSSMDVTVSNGTVSYAGGLVGSATLLDIADSFATGDITVEDGNQAARGVSGAAGGLVGGVTGGNNLTSALRIQDSYSTGVIDFSAVSPLVDTVGGPIVGGSVGMIVGWSKIEGVYATGLVTASINQACQIDECDSVIAMAGGLIGANIAVSQTASASVLRDSYATGMVIIEGRDGGALSGGAIGSLQGYNHTIEDVYATGSVGPSDNFIDSASSGFRAGGLIGDIRTAGTAVINRTSATGTASGTGYAINGAGSVGAGGLIGFAQGQVAVQNSFATGSVQGGYAAGGLIGGTSSVDYGQTRIALTNTYATGSVAGAVTTVPYDDLGGYIEIGSSVGGLVGVADHTDIASSYASGSLSNEEPQFATQIPAVAQAFYSSNTGGLVGVVGIIDDPNNPDFQSSISNSFSAAIITNVSGVKEGVFVGQFFHIFNEGEGTVAPSAAPNYLINNYFDASLTVGAPCANWLEVEDQINPGADTVVTASQYDDAAVCKPVNSNNQAPNYFRNNTTNPPLNTWDFTTPVWYSQVATYPTFVLGESLPGPPRNLGGTPTTSSIALSWQPPANDGGTPIIDYRIQYRLHSTGQWQEYVHPQSTSTSYIVSGLSPGTRYDFQVSAINAVGQSTWVLGVFDVQTPSTPAQPVSPTAPTSNTPATPTRPTRPSRPRTTTTTPSPVSEESPQPDQPKLLEISKIPEEELPLGLPRIARDPKVNPLPYFFLSWLLLLALYYTYRAWREYRYQKVMNDLLTKVITTRQSVSDFLAIITHYLNTPLSIMNGALELIASKHALQPEFIAQFKAKLVALQATSNNLTLQAEQALVSGDRSVVSGEVLAISNKQLWVPLVGIAGVVAVTDLVLYFNKSYDHSWGRYVNQLIWGFFGAIAIFVTFMAWKKQRQLHAQRKQQLATEQQLLDQKKTFVADAATSLASHASALQSGTAGLEQFPDTKLLTNGIGQLVQLSEALGKVNRFSVVGGPAPNISVKHDYEQNIAPLMSKLTAENGVAVSNLLSSNSVVQMQPEELAQIIRSTVENAIRFSNPNSAVTISSKSVGGKTLITVRDNGAGMSPEVMAHLFEPLTRGTDSTTFDHPGLGLNLYITRMILQKLGGGITVQSTPGKGTTVSVTIPQSHSSPTGFAPTVVTPIG
jgi:signal transduction histidine kinase